MNGNGKKQLTVSADVTKEGTQPDPISKDMQQQPGTNRKTIIIKATDRITMHFLFLVQQIICLMWETK